MKLGFDGDYGYKVEHVSKSPDIKNIDFQNFSFTKNPFLFVWNFFEFFRFFLDFFFVLKIRKNQSQTEFI